MFSVRCTNTAMREGGDRYVQSVDDSGNVTKDCQQDTDQEISSTSALRNVSENSIASVGCRAYLEEDTKRWEDDGKDDFNDVAVGGQFCSY